LDSIKNFAKVTVDGLYDDTDTSITLLTGHGARLPDPPFNAVWWNATDFPDPSDDIGVEIVRVTAKSGEILTITRAQEGTDASDHSLPGKTYQMIAGLTGKTVSDLISLLGDVFGSGIAVLVLPDESRLRLRFSSSRFLQVDTNTIELQSTDIKAGDVEGEGNSSYYFLDDTNGLFILNNLNLASSQTESATTAVGTLAGKLAVRNVAGTIVGYLPLYNSIT